MNHAVTTRTGDGRTLLRGFTPQLGVHHAELHLGALTATVIHRVRSAPQCHCLLRCVADPASQRNHTTDAAAGAPPTIRLYGADDRECLCYKGIGPNQLVPSVSLEPDPQTELTTVA